MQALNTLRRLLAPLGMTCPNCGGTMTPYGDRYKCSACNTVL